MEELIKEYYNLVDKMADKAYEESQSIIEPLLRKYGLKKLALDIYKVGDVYEYPYDIYTMFTKKSDIQKLDEMSDEDRGALEDDLQGALSVICEEYPASVVFEMLDNISIDNKHNFVIKVKY
jgi:hypothetical protein